MWKHLVSRLKSVSESTRMSVMFPVTFRFMKTWCWASKSEMKTGNQDWGTHPVNLILFPVIRMTSFFSLVYAHHVDVALAVCDVTADTTAMSLFILASLLLPPRWYRSCRQAEKVSVSALVSDQKKFKQEAKRPQSCLQKVTSLFQAAAASRWLKYKQEEHDQSNPWPGYFYFPSTVVYTSHSKWTIPGSILEGHADPFGAALGSKNSLSHVHASDQQTKGSF